MNFPRLNFPRILRQRPQLVALGIVLVAVGVFGMHQVAVQRELAQHERAIEIARAYEFERAKKELNQSQYLHSKQTAKDQAASNVAGSTNPVKYATSSDPRSAAYSLTPPSPSPASFEIKLTHNGQLAAGDLVFYNATKGEKGYYNGDLVLSSPTLMVSRNGPNQIPITVSSPNNKLISMPSSPWNDTSPYFIIATPGSTVPPPSLSYNMVVDAFNVPPPGTYQLHISSGCGEPRGDSCQSDVFITIVVID